MIRNEKNAIISQDGKCITYLELRKFCDVISSKVDKRQLLLIRCTISPQIILMYVAALKNRIPVMMVEKERDCSSVLENYAPEYIWQNAKDKYSDDYEENWKYYDYILLKRKNSVRYKMDDELALLLSTSGSIGSSKFVRISYRNIECNTKAIAEVLQMKEDDVAMVMLPLSYTYGLSVINTFLSVGATLLVPSVPMIHKDFWEFFMKCKGTVISGVPYSYEVIKKLNIFKKGLNNLRLVTASGGKLSAEIENYLLDMAGGYGFNFASMYGQTEATARISCHFLNENPSKRGSVGKALPGITIKICDDEIICMSPSVALGYAKNHTDLAKGDEWKGILRTGDVGEVDEEGYIYIKGRMKRIAKVNGHRISLDELESFLLSKTGWQCMVVERKDLIHIFIEEQMSLEDQEYVLELLKVFTGFHKVCFRVHFVELLPRNESGKLMYGEIM